MAYPQVYSRAFVDAVDGSAAASLRSRASSIVTTTTKFSLETLSQDDQSSNGTRWEWQRHGYGSRPRSMISMTSVAHPAPPYDQSVDSTLLLPGHRNGDFHFQPSSQQEAGNHINATPSINEALPPSPARSGTTTPSPESPIDPEENPHAQAAYYSNVVRTLDQNYTAAIERLRQEHVQQLALTRHDIDQAYRAQWKAKNKEIERIREETALAKDLEVERIKEENDARMRDMEEKISLLEQELAGRCEGQNTAIERARHEIEDIWEKRWSDRARIEREERERNQTTWQSRVNSQGSPRVNQIDYASTASNDKERNKKLAKVLRGEILRQRQRLGDWKEWQLWDELGVLETLAYTLETGEDHHLRLYQQEHGNSNKPKNNVRSRLDSGPNADTIRQILHNLDNTSL
ncbi:MAG: hypothetical protein LQ352_004870 [Teloschistes flavicans]|nr:MAG: hypothetical protein LQ352_004870 [Teloschistes flavicans]